MTTINDQVEYDNVKKIIQDEINNTVEKINEEMKKESSEEKTKNIANYFLHLSNMNQAKILVGNIKPTEKEE